MSPLSRVTKRNLVIAGHDALATAIAVILSFYLRFGGETFFERLPLLLVLLPYFVAFSIVICFVLDLTMTKWRFISLPDILNIIKAATVLSIGLMVLDYIFVSPNVLGTLFIGKTTIVIYWVLQIALFSGSRLAYRYYRFSRTRNRTRSAKSATSLIVGTAADSEILIRAAESGAIHRIWPVGLLSPSKADQGQLIRGVPVIGGIEDFSSVISDFANRGDPIERVVMTPSALAAESRPEDIIREARKAKLPVHRLPSLEDSREALQLAPVAVEDLLLRPSVKIDYNNLETLIRGKSVVVTGGGGSIGSEICNRVVSFGAARLMILEHSEPALYAIVEALLQRKGSVIEGRIADIRDRKRIFSVMADFKPDIVFHAAALKHVPILEKDFSEGVKTNIIGTMNVADASLAASAQAMVMISTDKAVEPISMLGLTKRFAEMYCQAVDHELLTSTGKPSMRLISVRFGNVLASNGSVVPKFKSQIEAGGPVTVTHPDMVRYFMTIREACDLVITSASHALGVQNQIVSVYVLNMGQPVRIADLADRMIRLSGLLPGTDIDIVYTGPRPGERLHEILFAREEPPTEIGVDGVMAAKADQPSKAEIVSWISELNNADERDHSAIKRILRSAIPEFNTRS